jgi:hypothetical protein
MTDHVTDTIRHLAWPKLHRASPLPCWRVLLPCCQVGPAQVHWWPVLYFSFEKEYIALSKHTTQVDVKIPLLTASSSSVAGGRSATRGVQIGGSAQEGDEQRDLDTATSVKTDNTTVRAEDILSCGVSSGIEGCVPAAAGWLSLALRHRPRTASRRQRSHQCGPRPKRVSSPGAA